VSSRHERPEANACSCLTADADDPEHHRRCCAMLQGWGWRSIQPLRERAGIGCEGMGKPALLLLGSRSRRHSWLLLAARGCGALVIGGAGVLAITHGHHHLGLWRAALIAVIVIAALTLVAAAGAYITQPVSDVHDASLKASAASVETGLTSEFVNYGGTYDAEASFRRHFPRLWKRLRDWDVVRTEAGERQRILGEHVDAALRDHGVVGDVYALGAIRTYAIDMALRQAGGDTPPQVITWGRNWGTTAVEPGAPAILGMPEGWLGPYDYAPAWIVLPPTAGESSADWQRRAGAYVPRIDAFVEAVRASSRDPAEAAVTAERAAAAFQEQTLPAIRDALRRIQIREPARHRLRCKSC